MSWWLWAVAGLALFVAVTIAGSNVFYGYVVPQLEVVKQLGFAVVLGFSFLAGVAAFFAPCPFAVFPAYMAYFLNTEASHVPAVPPSGQRIRHALWTGAVVSLGIFAFYLIMGIILALFGTALASLTNWIKLAVIPLFFIAGWMLLSGRSVGTQKLDAMAASLGRRARGGRHTVNMFLYGIVYGIAAAACHLPVLIVLALSPILAGSFLVGVGTFVSYALGASLLLVVFTVLISKHRQVLIRSLGLYGERVKKVAGVIFLLTGAYLVSFYLIFGM